MKICNFIFFLSCHIFTKNCVFWKGGQGIMLRSFFKKKLEPKPGHTKGSLKTTVRSVEKWKCSVVDAVAPLLPMHVYSVTTWIFWINVIHNDLNFAAVVPDYELQNWKHPVKRNNLCLGVCLFLCPIITHATHDRYATYFKTRECSEHI